MSHPRVGAATSLAVLALLLFAGCERDGDGGGDGCKSNLLPGDLVITEVMANPAGTDDGKEWFELYNATGSTLDLTGVELLAGKADGTDDDRHVMGAVTIESDQYLVLGGVLEVARPSYVDYVYEADLSLRNTDGGRLVVGCSGQVIDMMIYEEPSDGKSQGFDGAQVPDAVANDDAADWCEAEQEYEAGSAGSPGAKNEACEGDLPPTECRDGDAVRDVVPPQAGDLVINEFMANPSSTDGGKEWFEVYVGRDVDLNGLQIGKLVGTEEMMVTQSDCLRVSAGSFVLFASSDAPAVNGGLPAVDVVIDFTLGNSNSGLFIGVGGSVLDAIEYTSASDGVATALDPTKRNTLDNDAESNWCKAELSYGDGDKGTPGAANPSCGIVDPGHCIDGGAQRPIVAPTPGALVITEILANPTSTDTGKEWFEVYTATDVDLNGLQIGKLVGTNEMTLPQGECLRVGGDSYLVFAKNDNAASNGGLPRVDVLIDFTMNNSDSGLFLALDGELLDAVTYSSSTDGVAAALDPDKLDPTDNDNPDYWCDAEAAYGDGNLGSPGEENASCGIVEEGQCLDGGVARNKVAPAVGDLIVNEFMANPNAVGDGDGEWFEVAVTRDVDLNGLELGRKVEDGVDQTLPEGECLAVAAGSFVLFAKNSDAGTNGGLPTVDHAISFSLTNSGSGLFLGLDGAVLDAITWTSTGDGASTALDPGKLDATENDSPDSWCRAEAVYGDGDKGTPRVANPVCP